MSAGPLELDAIHLAFLAVAHLAVDAGEAEIATSALAADSAYEPRIPHQPREHHAARLTRRTRSVLGPDRFDAAWHRGTRSSPSEVLGLAIDRYRSDETPVTGA